MKFIKLIKSVPGENNHWYGFKKLTNKRSEILEKFKILYKGYSKLLQAKNSGRRVSKLKKKENTFLKRANYLKNAYKIFLRPTNHKLKVTKTLTTLEKKRMLLKSKALAKAKQVREYLKYFPTKRTELRVLISLRRKKKGLGTTTTRYIGREKIIPIIKTKQQLNGNQLGDSINKLDKRSLQGGTQLFLGMNVQKFITSVATKRLSLEKESTDSLYVLIAHMRHLLNNMASRKFPFKKKKIRSCTDGVVKTTSLVKERAVSTAKLPRKATTKVIKGRKGRVIKKNTKIVFNSAMSAKRQPAFRA